MAKPFLIVGLPRSRTAWLSAVCNTVPGAICYHEPFLEAETWQASLSVWQSNRYEFVGISDSGLGFHLAEIMAEHRPRVLFVDRPAHEVEASVTSIGFAAVPGFCRLLLDRIAPLRCHSAVKVVPFHALSSASVMRACLWHLMPGAAIDTDKIALLQHLNVQADMRRVKRIIADRAAELPAMVGNDVLVALQAAQAAA